MNTVNILGVIILVTMVVFSRPIWRWIKAGDKPEPSAATAKPGRSTWPIVRSGRRRNLA
jgi:hypothetical protein